MRIACRKIGVSRRTEAVLWALRNGFGTVPLTSAATEAPYPDSQAVI